jgi:transposase
MRRRSPPTVRLSKTDRDEIERLLRDGRTEQRGARRGRGLFAMQESETVVTDLSESVGLTRTGIGFLCRRYEALGLNAIYDAPRTGRPREITALQRVAIEQLAGCEPAGMGLNMTQWSARSLASIAVKRGVVAQIAHSTISLILREADLQPHRSRYWITPTLDAKFLQRAGRILWLSERVDWLWAPDEIVLALDEKPHIQALERARPTQRMRPGIIERQEFEYIRHGTVNLLALLNGHDGQMRSACLDKNDREHLCRALPKRLRPFRQFRRVHLICDGGPSHTSAATAADLQSYEPGLRVLFTPAHASWLNQAELLLKSFEVRYRQRGHWASRQDLIDHLKASAPEYNRLWAHPINWSWTRRDLHKWADKKTSRLC